MGLGLGLDGVVNLLPICRERREQQGRGHLVRVSVRVRVSGQGQG